MTIINDRAIGYPGILYPTEGPIYPTERIYPANERFYIAPNTTDRWAEPMTREDAQKILNKINNVSQAPPPPAFVEDVDENVLVLSHNVPGVNPNNIEVSTTGNLLVVEYNKRKYTHNVSPLYDISTMLVSYEFGVLYFQVSQAQKKTLEITKR